MAIIRYITIVLAAVPSLGFAQDTDAPVFVKALLDAYGPVAVRSARPVERTREVCKSRGRPTGDGPGGLDSCKIEKWVESEAVDVQQVLTAYNLRISNTSPIVFGPPVVDDLPRELFVANQSAQNCSNTPQLASLSLSVVLNRSESVTITESISNTIGGSLGVQLGVPGVGNISGGLSLSRTVTTAVGSTSTAGMTISRSGSANVAVPPKTHMVAQIRAWLITVKVPFETMGTIDGDLSSNVAQKAHLSDLFSPEHRRARIKGFAQVRDGTDGSIVFFESAYDDKLCGPNRSLLQTNLAGKPDTAKWVELPALEPQLMPDNTVSQSP